MKRAFYWLMILNAAVSMLCMLNLVIELPTIQSHREIAGKFAEAFFFLGFAWFFRYLAYRWEAEKE